MSAITVPRYDFTVYPGHTSTLTLQWESTTLIYKPISAVVQDTPLRVTCTGHGLPDGWRVKFSGVTGAIQLNARGWSNVTVIDSNTLEFPEIDFSDYEDLLSGNIYYHTPMDLSTYTSSGQFVFKSSYSATGNWLLITTADDMTVNNITKKITVTFDGSNTAALLNRVGVYELYLADDVIMMHGVLRFIKED